MITDNKLNKGQQAASDGIFKFLLGEESGLIITGAAGYGKTFLMGDIIDSTIPAYLNSCKLLNVPPKIHSVHMTATTNKAAQQLGLATGRPVVTIFNLLGIVVTPDFKTGKQRLKVKNNHPIVENSVIFIDEYTYISRDLYPYLFSRTRNCKFVFVGDKFQLTAVGEPNCIVDTKGYPTYELTEPMRNKGEPYLVELCSALREGVRNTSFGTILEMPGVVDWISDGAVMQALINDKFKQKNDTDRVLAYTNKQVVGYNGYIRNLQGLPPQFTEGETLISNEVVTVGMQSFIRIEEDATIVEFTSEEQEYSLPDDASFIYRNAEVMNQFGETANLRIPQDYSHFRALIKYFQRKKDWYTYYELKEKFPDLRDRSASTVHKSQGSTYDTVYIDLTDIGSCNIPDMVARMLYVAVSRAKSRVVLYGNLPAKYGRIIKHE